MQVFHEYMDTLRLPDPGLQVSLFDYLRARYAHAKLDMILASDNEALAFLLNYRDWLFGPIPVVFTGINGYKPAMLLGQKGYTGVAEQVDLLSTLQVALNLRPQTRRVVVFGPLSMTYFENLKQLRAAVAKLGGGLQVVERPGVPLDKVLKEVAGLGQEDMVLLTEPVPNERGQLVSFSHSTPLITKASSAPVYSLWEPVLGKGIVGGKLVSPSEQGRVAAEMALKILAGRDPASLPVVTKSPNRYMFDYQQLVRFHMPFSALPPESIIINRPQSLWDRHKAVILGVAVLLILMSLTIAALSFAMLTRRRAVAALRKSEERFRTVVEQAADAFFVIDGEGLIHDVNQAACQSLRYTRDQLLGMPITKVDTRVDQDRHKELFWAKLTGGRSVQFESEHQRSDGTTFPVEMSLGQIEVAGQKLILGLGRDISERKRHEKERLEQLRFMKSLDQINRAIQGSNDLDQMMSDVLGQVLAIFDCDRAWLVYPCDPEAPSWRVPMERTRPEYPGAHVLGSEIPMQDEVAEGFKELLAAGGPLRFDPQSSRPLPPETAERFGFKSFMGMAVFPKTGKPWEFGLHQCSHARVWTPEEERLLQEIGRRLSDAMSTLLAHLDLKEGEERYRTLVSNLPDFVVRYDNELRRTYVNPSWEKASGLSAAEVIGVSASDIPKVPNPVVDGYLVSLRETLETGIPQTKEFTWINARDEELYLQYTMVPEFDSQGRVTGVLSVGHDLTKRKKAEQALQRLNRELRAISSCNQALIRASDEQGLLEEVCRILCEEAGYLMAWVGLAEDDEAKTVRPAAWAGHDSGYVADIKATWADTEQGRGPTGTAIRGGTSVSTQDLLSDPDFAPWRENALQRGYRSSIALPLKDDQARTFGALNLYSSEPYAFTPDEVRLLEEMAEDLAFGIMTLRTRAARNQAEDELRQSEETKTILNQIANVFLTAPDEDIYAEVLAVILKVMKSDFGIFGYLDEKGDLVIPSLTRDVWGKCQVPEKSVVFPACTWGESLWGRAIRQKRAFFADAPFKTPEGHITINNFLTAPVVFGERAIGLLSVANKQGGYGEPDQELLVGIASSISPILNARLQRDTHERKRLEAERALRESGERITALFNATTDSIILLNPEGGILAINEEGAQRRGTRAEELEGKSIYDILPQAVASTREAKIREVADTSQPAVFEEEWDGNFYLVRMFPVLDNKEEVKQIACFARDVTGLKHADEEKAKLEGLLRQAQKMEAIGTLAGGIAHDFNNILAAIMGFTEMALDNVPEGDQVQNDLEHVLAAAERAKDLIRQILTFSRKVEHDLKPLALNKVVNQVAQLLEKTIPKMIRLEMELADDLEAINADANQLEQVVLNLSVNAADAMPEGGELKIVTKNLWVEEQACMTCGKHFSGRYVALAVSDSGQGMDQQTLEHIFEPFYTTKDIGKGTGLGLATVYGIAQAHNCHVTCQSEPGAGTTFTLYFSTIGGKEEAYPAAETAGAILAGGHEEILLVDDEEAIRRLGKRVLKTSGYQVVTASSGEMAIEACLSKEKGFDLIIMDLGMPGMGGYRAMKTILEANPRARVLVASGYASDEQMKDALNSGAVGYVAKPFKKAELLATVRSVLDKS